jgi:hypothetical protein
VELLVIAGAVLFGIAILKLVAVVLGVAVQIVLLPLKILAGLVLFVLALPLLALVLPFVLVAGIGVFVGGVLLLVGGIVFGVLSLLALAP